MYKITKEKREKILNFYYKYKNFFSESAQYLFEQFEEENDIFCDILLEMYTYFHAIEIEINPNFEFYQYLCEKHPNLKKRKILEVACGYIPGISYMINLKEQMETPIIAMDPKILPEKIIGIQGKREKFTDNTGLKDIDLLIAQCPCEAFEPLINKAISEKKEFSIQMCKCVQRDYAFYSRNDWLYYVESIIERLAPLEDAGFAIEKNYLDFSYELDAPIITARKRTLSNSTKFHQ